MGRSGKMVNSVKAMLLAEGEGEVIVTADAAVSARGESDMLKRLIQF